MGLTQRVRSFPLRGDGSTAEAWTQVKTSIDKIPSQHPLIVIVSTHGTLRALVKQVRTARPDAYLASVTSVERDMLESGDVEGLHVLYSFPVALYSVATLEFNQYARIAQEVAANSGFVPDGIEWPAISTIDAEVHDALAYWLDTRVPAFTARCKQPRDNLYVTNFAFAGEGRTARNDSPLFLYKVANKEMTPVRVQ